ncbi:uncharacterized protein LOC111044736 isoform X2 [Nilaparvata lugens]|uniref:uncharacterized protein LOC111044736 isoform X2 n=1 Tax=Nilaparvata lugens TaxID=108931 RepID=UPI00193C9E6A|nr:uncharacterized protein LOC111044736 isoform X2 [Nilaparvata lugens]
MLHVYSGILWVVLLITSASTLETATLQSKDARNRPANAGDIDRKEITSDFAAVTDEFKLPLQYHHHHHVNERVADLAPYHDDENITSDSTKSAQTDLKSQTGTNLDSRVDRLSNTSNDELIDSEHPNNPVSNVRSPKNNGSTPIGPILNFDSNSNIIREPENTEIEENPNRRSQESAKTKDLKNKQNDTKKLYKEKSQINEERGGEIFKKLLDNDGGKSEIEGYKIRYDVKCSTSSEETSEGSNRCGEHSNNRTVDVYKLERQQSGVSVLNTAPKTPLVQKLQGSEHEDEQANRSDSIAVVIGTHQNSNQPSFSKAKSKSSLEAKTYSKDVPNQSTTKGLDDSRKKTKVKSKSTFHEILENEDIEYVSSHNSNDSLYLMNDQPNEPPATSFDEDVISSSPSPSTVALDDSSEFLHHDNDSVVAVNASVIETNENSSAVTSANGRTMKAMSNNDVHETESYFQGSDLLIIVGIVSSVVILSSLIGAASFILYRHRYWNKPQTLSDKCSNADSSGYIDDSTLRENSEEMYSLDNDSFLNSLEAMTIQNYWTDNVKHTKL